MRRPGRFPDTGDDPAYARLKARVIARTGHHYYTDKDDLLIDRLHRRFRAAGAPDCAAYAALLADGSAGEAEWAQLEAEITIGETFFFRYAEQFRALRETILPELVAARAAERSLRIWSAGCSTGAEPYSLAILARERLGEALPDWRVAILGTDISAEALAAARTAEYGRWALRSLPPEDRPRYFARLPDQSGAHREGGYALRPEFRTMVRFERDNLLGVAESGPAPSAALHDLILCRNVLIYFDAETAAAVVRGLGRRLRPGGWLLLGHAEPNPAFAAFLDPVNLPGTVAYRPRSEAVPLVATTAMPDPSGGDVKAGEDPVVSARPNRAVPGVAQAPGPPMARPPAAPPRAMIGARRPALPGPSGEAGDRDLLAPADAGAALARVRALADAGETGAAWRAVRAALVRDPADAALRLYEGLIAKSLGREAEAERAFRAALYLQRNFVMAHYHLGLLLLSLGRPAEAARALDNAIALSQVLPPDAPVPEGDGAPAGAIAAGAAAARAGIGRAVRGRA